MVEKSALHSAAIEYAQKGWRVFPLRQGSKKPATPDGFKSATTDLRQIDRWWLENPRYNIGIATGETVVVDIDPSAGGSDWLIDHPEVVDLLQLGEIQRTPRRGLHYVFACGEFPNLTCSAGRIGNGIDVRANGGYLAVAPSVTVDGRYDWVSGEIPIADQLPHIPDELGQLIESARLDNDFEQLAGSETFQKIHCRHDYFLEIAKRLRGIGVWPDLVKQVIKVVNRSMLHEPRTENDEFDREIDRMMSPPGVVPAEDVVWMRGLEKNINGDRDAWISNMPAVFQDACGYYESICSLYQPELFLGAFIAATATAIGQAWHSHTKVSSNIYVLGLCATAKGKEHTRKAVRNMLQAAMLGDHCSSGKMSSDASIYTTLSMSNPHLKLSDEFGLILERCSNPNENPHSARIIDAFLQLYSNSDDSQFSGVEYADAKARKEIPFPLLSVYGTGTPATFWPSINQVMFANGLLPRTIVLEGRDDPEPRSPVLDAQIPESVIEMFRACTRIRGSVLDGETCNPRQVMPIGDIEARRLESFAIDCRTRVNDEDPVSLMWTRAAENAHKLAMVHAVWRSAEAPEIEAVDLDFAVETICHSINQFRRQARDSYHETTTQAAVQKVYRIIRRRCEMDDSRVRTWCERSYLVRSSRIPSRQLDVILETMGDSDILETAVVDGMTVYRVRSSH